MFDYSKDGITIAAFLDDRKPKKTSKYPVKIRVTYRRERKYYTTGKSLSVEEWEKLPQTKSPQLLRVRQSINNTFTIVCDTVDELASNAAFSFDSLNVRLKKAATDTLSTAFEAKIAELLSEDRIGSMMYYKGVLRSIESFGGSNALLADVTVEWLKRYDRFLKSDDKAQTTIGMYMRAIRAIMNDARRLGVIKDAQYPFGKDKYEIQSGEGRKLALTLEQIGRIAKYNDGNQTTARYRDYWLFLYFCNGINVADMVKLKFSNIVDGEIRFVRQKTERTSKTRKEVRAVLIDQMEDIIKRWGNRPSSDSYIFPVLQGGETALEIKNKTNYFVRAINKYMAEISKALGLVSVSTYTARHSYATVLKRSGANINYISESLGHSDLKTTETYLASFEKEERQKNAALLTQFK